VETPPVRESTATALVSQYRPPLSKAVESAGPCLVDRCGGQLEVRHERQFGKVYTVCPKCELRVREVGRLREEIARLLAERVELRSQIAAARGRGTVQARVYQPKACRRCTKVFIPTGPRALDCDACWTRKPTVRS
jgi:hypothetical protein